MHAQKHLLTDRLKGELGFKGFLVSDIIFAGRPVIITGRLPMADAWVAAWLPGSEAEGVTDVLFGDKTFVGRLPYTWPDSVDRLPLKVTGCAVSRALFPYGYGLNAADNRALDAPVTCP